MYAYILYPTYLFENPNKSLKKKKKKVVSIDFKIFA